MFNYLNSKVGFMGHTIRVVTLVSQRVVSTLINDHDNEYWNNSFFFYP